MSLEQAIADLTAALKENTATTKDLMAMRADAIEKVQAVAGSTGKSTSKKGETKTDEAAKPNISASPEDRKDPADAGAASNPYEGIKEQIAGYLGAAEWEEERTARKGKIKALLNHEKIRKATVKDGEAKNVDDIMESAVDLFKSQVVKLVEKGNLTEKPTEAKKDDDLDLS